VGQTKVLIVDDNRDLAFGLQIRLRASRYHVLLARDAGSALSLAAAEIHCAMILDLVLPGEDGFSVLERLRRSPTLASVAVVVVSADRSPANRERALDAGARAFLEKPVDYPYLLATLRDIESHSAKP
jgi:DNA-binding response OmpR family regulator